MTSEPLSLPTLGRRGLLLGAGAAALAVGVVGSTTPAAANPSSIDGAAEADGTPDGTPASIASAPVSGWTYRTVCMYDFFPFEPTAQRTWGGYGVYPANVATTFRATVELPAGALVRDVEYYVYNNSGAPWVGDTELYVAGTGSVMSIGAVAAAPSTGTIAATRAVLGASGTGPYPVASRLLIRAPLPASGQVQINGARVGFSQGAASAGLLNAPYRAYDSRVNGGKIAAGATRTITFPSNIVPPGTSGVMVNITATGATASGYLKVFSAAAAEPTASALNYAGSSIANALIVAVSTGRQIKIRASQSVHVIVDVTGTIA